MRFSLKKRLLISIALSVAVLLGIFLVIIYTASRHALMTQFDQALHVTATLLMATLEDETDEHDHHEGHKRHGHHDDDDEDDDDQGESELEFELDIRRIPAFNMAQGGSYYEFWNMQQESMMRSPSLVDDHLEIALMVLPDLNPKYASVTLPGNKYGRMVYLVFTPRGNGQEDCEPIMIAVAKDVTEIIAHLSFLKWLLMIAGAVIVCLSILAAFMITSASLNPLLLLAKQINEINIDKLATSTLPENQLIELLPVVTCLNDLLKRLQYSFEHEKRFNSDVAHELRTPIAGLQSILEVSLSQDRKVGVYQDDMKRCLNISQQMHRMVDSLLAITQLDAEGIHLNKVRVAIKDEIDTMWLPCGDRAHDRGIQFTNYVAKDVVIDCDKDYFAIIFKNILENAVTYANEGGCIDATVQVTDLGCAIGVTNSGCDLTQGDVNHVFDALWRKDTARTHTDVHCGLGLAIVKKVVILLGGEVSAVVSTQGEFKITVCLPIL